MSLKKKVSGEFVDVVPIPEAGPAIVPGDPGTILSSDAEGELVWVDPAGSPFRGSWASDELVWSGSFAAGLVSPFSVSRSEVTGALVPVSASGPFVNPHEPIRMFDSDTATVWGSSTKPAAVVADMGSAKTLETYTLYRYGPTPLATPTEWVLSGSNDGTNWTAIDSRTTSWVSATPVEQEFSIATPLAWRYYRWNFTNNGGDNWYIMHSMSLAGFSSSLPEISLVVPDESPYTHSAKMMISHTGVGNKSILSLDLAGLPPDLTRTKFWYKSVNGGANDDSALLRVDADGVQAFEGSGLDWTEADVALLPDIDVIDYMTIGDTGNLSEDIGYYITGIRLYSIAEPYMLGEFVTHAGEMWESLIDNNSETPSSTSVAWERVLTLPPVKGTSAQRPSAVTAGAGFQYYDTTLGLPIWSNGTEWTDAAGFEVV